MPDHSEHEGLRKSAIVARRLQLTGRFGYDRICNNLAPARMLPGVEGAMTQIRTIVSKDEPDHPARHNFALRPELTGCPWHDVKAMLRDVGLRPTRQRMALGWILFAKGDRHLTAEMLYEEASKAKVPVSLATVYNTLHQFTEVGLLRQVAVDGSKTYFDTNVSDHHHFFVEGENALVDIPNAEVIVDKLPIAPNGYEVARVDVVVRLKKRD
jgi:Fur family transcriptional regulator, iron response regulator